MAFKTILALVAAVLVLLATAADARRVLVGNRCLTSRAWTFDFNYTTWQADYPLYVGDYATFKYPKYFNNVYKFPTFEEYEACNFLRARQIGGDTQGVGRGYYFKVTSTPVYVASGIYGYCEGGQKAIINGTIGPLPKVFLH